MDFLRPCEVQETLPPLTDEPSSSFETTSLATAKFELPDNITQNETSDSLESFDHDEEDNSNILTNSINTQLSIGQESQKPKAIFSIFENNESPSTQRKRRQRKPRDELKKKSVSKNESDLRILNLKDSKKRGDKSLLFDELIVTDDDSEDDFKQLRKLREKMTKKDDSCLLLTDDEDPSIMASKVQKIQSDIKSTFQPSITSTFRSSTFQPAITSTLAKSSLQKTQVISNNKDIEYEFID